MAQLNLVLTDRNYKPYADFRSIRRPTSNQYAIVRVRSLSAAPHRFLARRNFLDYAFSRDCGRITQDPRRIFAGVPHNTLRCTVETVLNAFTRGNLQIEHAQKQFERTRVCRTTGSVAILASDIVPSGYC